MHCAALFWCLGLWLLVLIGIGRPGFSGGFEIAPWWWMILKMAIASQIIFFLLRRKLAMAEEAAEGVDPNKPHEVFDELSFESPCPYCRKPIQRRARSCPHCGNQSSP